MQLTDAIARLYQGNKFVLDLNLEDLSHEDSLLQPPAGANNLNWILGHILGNRMRALELLERESLWSDDLLALYRRGSQAITAETARPLPDLLADLERSQEILLEGLAKAPESLITSGEEQTVGQQVLGLAWHETYHAGQTDFLRRLAGKQEGGVR